MIFLLNEPLYQHFYFFDKLNFRFIDLVKWSVVYFVERKQIRMICDVFDGPIKDSVGKIEKNCQPKKKYLI
jgi:hypothetical protein